MKGYEKVTSTRSKNGTFAEGRLTRDEQLRVIQWCVELKSNYEIADLIKDEFDKVISPKNVWRYRNCAKWKPLIARLRKRFEREMCKIPVANKADRIRYLQKVIREGLKWSLKAYSKTGKPVYELKLGAVTQAIQAARVELEGDTPAVKVEQHTHYTNINVKELKNKNDRELIDTVLGRALDGSRSGANGSG